MSKKILSIKDVADAALCCGCGTCAYLSPEEIEMRNIIERGKRPHFKTPSLEDRRSKEAFASCPGIRLDHRFDQKDSELIKELISDWGPVRDVMQGYASDSLLRYYGSSGGVASAIALYCIEKGGMHGALHAKAQKFTSMQLARMLKKRLRRS